MPHIHKLIFKKYRTNDFNRDVWTVPLGEMLIKLSDRKKLVFVGEFMGLRRVRDWGSQLYYFNERSYA